MSKKVHGRAPRYDSKVRIPMKGKVAHAFTMSAVREYCICGELEGHKVHQGFIAPKKPRYLKVRLVFPPKDPPVPRLVQVSIDPDTPQTRQLITETLGWAWVDKIDDGLWNIRPPVEWNEEAAFAGLVTVGRYEVRLSLERP